MEILLSVVLGEVATRSIDFFIRKFSKPQALDVDDRIRRILLRAQVIVDEAMGRHITNYAMLQQLDMLRDAMHRGDYILDTFRYQSHDEGSKDQAVSHYLSLSKLNSLKGFCSSNRKIKILEQLQEAYDSLSSMVLDVEGLALFLTSYARLNRQPYSMHLVLGNCMFGHQMEAELVLNFLLHTPPNGAEELEVLPIVGPGKVGKSTLVAHVCHEERVRNNFSEIVFLNNHDFRDETEKFEKNYQNFTLKNVGRMLIVIEMAGDFVNEGEWKRLYSAFKRCVAIGSKIIITSQSDKITKHGTTSAVTLKYLSHEAYCYFFKTLTFGSTDPMMHPRMAYLAMEISRTLNGSLLHAMTTLCLLRDNFDVHFWCKVLAFLKGLINWHVSKFGEHTSDALDRNRPAHIWRMLSTSEQVMVYRQYECSSQEEVPKIALRDVIYGSIKPSGRFEALVWRSPIPPYYNYIYTCEIRDLKTTTSKRKRS